MGNYSQTEIDQFNSQAAFWWDQQGPLKTLHQINPCRLAYIQSHCSLPGCNVLDVGCGGGILSESIAVQGAHVTGIDLAEASLKTAKLHLFESGLTINYLLQSAEDHAAEKPAYYDVVTCLEMLEHVPDPESVIDACLTCLKPGGWLFLSTLNRTPKAMLLGIIAAEHILKLIPIGTHRYEQFIKPSELVNFLSKKSITIKNISGMRYNPVNGSATIHPTDLAINYLIAIQKN